MFSRCLQRYHISVFLWVHCLFPDWIKESSWTFFHVYCCIWCPDIHMSTHKGVCGNMAALIHRDPFHFPWVTTGSPQLVHNQNSKFAPEGCFWHVFQFLHVTVLSHSPILNIFEGCFIFSLNEDEMEWKHFWIVTGESDVPSAVSAVTHASVCWVVSPWSRVCPALLKVWPLHTVEALHTVTQESSPHL